MYNSSVPLLLQEHHLMPFNCYFFKNMHSFPLLKSSGSKPTGAVATFTLTEAPHSIAQPLLPSSLSQHHAKSHKNSKRLCAIHTRFCTMSAHRTGKERRHDAHFGNFCLNRNDPSSSSSKMWMDYNFMHLTNACNAHLSMIIFPILIM